MSPQHLEHRPCEDLALDDGTVEDSRFRGEQVRDVDATVGMRQRAAQGGVARGSDSCGSGTGTTSEPLGRSGMLARSACTSPTASGYGRRPAPTSARMSKGAESASSPACWTLAASRGSDTRDDYGRLVAEGLAVRAPG